MRTHTGLLSALALVFFAGSPAALAGPEEKSKNPIFRAAERAKQSQPSSQPSAAPSRPAQPTRPEPRASTPAPRQSTPAPSATRTSEPSRNPIFRAAERATQSRPTAQPRTPEPSPPRAAEPTRTVHRPSTPTSTPTSTPGTPRTAEPSRNPIFRAVERARTAPSQQPRVIQPPRTSAPVRSPETSRPSVPRVVPSGDSPEPRWSGTVSTDRTGPLRTAEIARRNMAAIPTPGQSGQSSSDFGGGSRNGSHRDADFGSDGRGGSHGNWSGSRDHDRLDRDWNGRDRGHRGWDGHGRSSWSFSLGIDGEGFAIGLGYSSGGCYPRRHFIPCDPWPVHRPIVRRHSHLHTSAWCRPLWVEPVWCGPTYRYRCVPVYSSFAWDASDDCSPWTSSVVAVKQPTIVYDTPSVTTYVNDAPQWVTYDAPVIASAVTGVDGNATIYRGQGDLGQMVWSAVPSSIVDSVLSVGPSERANAAARFLARRPAGGWQVIFESQRRVGDIVWVQTRGVTSSQFGTPPTVRLALSGELEGVRAGQQMTVTGRLTEVSIDDPRYPFGVLTLEEADVAR